MIEVNLNIMFFAAKFNVLANDRALAASDNSCRNERAYLLVGIRSEALASACYETIGFGAETGQVAYTSAARNAVVTRAITAVVAIASARTRGAAFTGRAGASGTGATRAASRTGAAGAGSTATG